MSVHGEPLVRNEPRLLSGLQIKNAHAEQVPRARVRQPGAVLPDPQAHEFAEGELRRQEERVPGPRPEQFPGGSCIKIGLPGKSILR